MSKIIPTYADNPAETTLLAAFAMLALINQKSKSIPPEEKLRREQEYQQAREQHRTEVLIHQGRCPDCGNKLIRGKKDKRNDYKRTWTCSWCHKAFSL